MTGAWEQALAECEQRLDTLAAALESGSATLSAELLSDPVVAGPLPAELEARARRIVERTESLEARLAARQDDIRTELRRLPRMPPAPRATRFDSRV